MILEVSYVYEERSVGLIFIFMEKNLENETPLLYFRQGIFIHRELGPGLLESIYEKSFYSRIKKVSFRSENQVSLPLQVGMG